MRPAGVPRAHCLRQVVDGGVRVAAPPGSKAVTSGAA